MKPQFLSPKDGRKKSGHHRSTSFLGPVEIRRTEVEGFQDPLNLFLEEKRKEEEEIYSSPSPSPSIEEDEEKTNQITTEIPLSNSEFVERKKENEYLNLVLSHVETALSRIKKLQRITEKIPKELKLSILVYICYILGSFGFPLIFVILMIIYLHKKTSYIPNTLPDLSRHPIKFNSVSSLIERVLFVTTRT
jgi:hypothetical protein